MQSIYGKHIYRGLRLFFFLLLFFLFSFKLFADEINWKQVLKTNDEIQFIDIKSIKYNNKGLLTVLTKHSEISPDDQKIKNTNIYIMAIDCENRLYNNLPVNGEIKNVKSWDSPLSNKLIKKTIITSCAA